MTRLEWRPAITSQKYPGIGWQIKKTGLRPIPISNSGLWNLLQRVVTMPFRAWRI